MLCHGLDFDDTHSDSIAPRQRRHLPGRARGRRGGTAPPARDALAAIVGGERGRDAASAWRPPATSTRAASTRPRSAGSSARPRPPRASAGSTRRRRRAPSGSPARSRRGSSPTSRTARRRSPSTRRWAAHGGARSPRGSPRSARRARPACSRESSASTTPSSAPAKDEVDLDAQLADLGSRWETPRIAFKPYPACHFMHGSLGATAEAGAGGLRPGRRSRRSSSPCRPRASPLVLEPADDEVAPRTEYEAKFSLQYSDGRDARARPRRRHDLHRRGDPRPGVLELAAKVRYETKDVPDLPGRLPRRRTDHDEGRAHARGRPPAPARRAGEPDERRRGAGEVPRERRARPRRRTRRGARGGGPRPRGAATTCGRPSRRSPPRALERTPA